MSGHARNSYETFFFRIVSNRRLMQPLLFSLEGLRSFIHGARIFLPDSTYGYSHSETLNSVNSLFNAVKPTIGQILDKQVNNTSLYLGKRPIVKEINKRTFRNMPISVVSVTRLMNLPPGHKITKRSL